MSLAFTIGALVFMIIAFAASAFLPVALAVIMHRVARFCTSGERAHIGYPTFWIGVRQLAVRRVWG
jgi:hypothetical protein